MSLPRYPRSPAPGFVALYRSAPFARLLPARSALSLDFTAPLSSWRGSLRSPTVPSTRTILHTTILRSHHPPHAPSSTRTILHAPFRSHHDRYIIDPRHSKFMRYWDICTVAALVFTAIFTPVEVSFLTPPSTPWDGLFLINRLVDLVFITDFCLSFVLMYPVSTTRSLYSIRALRDLLSDSLCHALANGARTHLTNTSHPIHGPCGNAAPPLTPVGTTAIAHATHTILHNTLHLTRLHRSHLHRSRLHRSRLRSRLHHSLTALAGRHGLDGRRSLDLRTEIDRQTL